MLHELKLACTMAENLDNVTCTEHRVSYGMKANHSKYIISCSFAAFASTHASMRT